MHGFFLSSLFILESIGNIGEITRYRYTSMVVRRYDSRKQTPAYDQCDDLDNSEENVRRSVIARLAGHCFLFERYMSFENFL